MEATVSRAATYEQKRAVMERILAVWAALPEQRLGQVLNNALDGLDENSPDLFYVEDFDLADTVEAYHKNIAITVALLGY